MLVSGLPSPPGVEWSLCNPGQAGGYFYQETWTNNSVTTLSFLHKHSLTQSSTTYSPASQMGLRNEHFHNENIENLIPKPPEPLPPKQIRWVIISEFGTPKGSVNSPWEKSSTSVKRVFLGLFMTNEPAEN